MRRFFFDPAERDGEYVRLKEDESHHLVRVLRLGIGDRVELFDGVGRVYDATVTALGNRVELVLGKICLEEKVDDTELVLLQSVLKNERMDLAIQKATELGVNRVLPVHTARCQGKLVAAAKKRERWQRISLAACKQCMRPQIMEIDEPMPIDQALAVIPLQYTKILFWEEEQKQNFAEFGDQLAIACGAAIFLGPEGGVTREEVELAKKHGWQSASLGRRILRAETATITTVSLVQFFMGKLSLL